MDFGRIKDECALIFFRIFSGGRTLLILLLLGFHIYYSSEDIKVVSVNGSGKTVVSVPLGSILAIPLWGFSPPTTTEVAVGSAIPLWGEITSATEVAVEAGCGFERAEPFSLQHLSHKE